MEIKVGFDINLRPPAAADADGDHALRSIPSRRSDMIGAETITAEPNVPIGFLPRQLWQYLRQASWPRPAV